MEIGQTCCTAYNIYLMIDGQKGFMSEHHELTNIAESYHLFDGWTMSHESQQTGLQPLSSGKSGHVARRLCKTADSNGYMKMKILF